MRVLFYVGDKQWSGASRALLSAAKGLSTRGHAVTIACCPGSRLDERVKAEGLERVTIQTGGWAGSGSLDLRKVLKDKFIEVAVVASERDHLIVSSAMRAAERGAVLRRVASFERMELARSGRLAMKLAASGAIVSTAGEVDAIKDVAWAIKPAVVPLGVDPTRYDEVTPASRQSLDAPDKGILITCAYDASGRFRMGAVFRTLALLASRNRNLHVAVLGPGSNGDDLRMHAAALGVGHVMSFLGERDDDASVLRASNVGWVVSSADDAAFSCLELMALRIPVMAMRTPLIERYVLDGSNGVLVTDDDPSMMASVLAPLLLGDDRRAALGNAGRSRVERAFLETTMIDGFERAVAAAADRSKWAKH